MIQNIFFNVSYEMNNYVIEYKINQFIIHLIYFNIYFYSKD